MALTRRDFESVATSLGLAWRFGRDCGDPNRDGVMLEAAMAVANGFRDVAPRFDRDRFVAWVTEVADGKRGADGKLRKGCAGCADAADMAALGWDDYYCRAHRSAELQDV